jgi:hypothetical protein
MSSHVDKCLVQDQVLSDFIRTLRGPWVARQQLSCVFLRVVQGARATTAEVTGTIACGVASGVTSPF